MDRITDLDEYSDMETIYNKDAVLDAEKCGCCYCLNIFPTDEITQFEDEAAICPYCKSDSVLPMNFDSTVEEIELHIMNQRIMNEYEALGDKLGL